MKQVTQNRPWQNYLALLLVLPGAYFLTSNLLNEIGVSAPYQLIAPLFVNEDTPGTREWWLNLMIVLGPALAIALTIFQVITFQLRTNREKFNLQVSIQKKWFPMLVTAFSLGLLAFLFGYLLVENCNCAVR